MADNKQINIKIEDLIPTLLDGCQNIVCGNGDFTVNFSFDEEWTEHNVKTALFVCGGVTYPSVFEGNICNVPEIADGTICYIGVVSGDINAETEKPRKKTSIWCEVCATPSITSIASEPKPPAPDVYVEIMALLNKYIEQGGGENGKDGFSPTISITPINNGHRITITDINGDHSFDVLNGEKGEKGEQGEPYVLTEEDKEIIVQDVINSLPNGDEVYY